jgi:hypothetical protein
MNDDSRKLQPLVNEALKYTGLVLTRSLALDGSWRCGAASCVYVQFGSWHLAVTCRHVEAKSDLWYVNAPAIGATLHDLASMPASSPSWPLAVWTDADIAFFNADPKVVRANSRAFVDLKAGTELTRDKLPKSASAIITGIWAAQSQYEKARDFVLFDPFAYTAKGEIVDVQEHEIMARFEEHEVVVWNEAERQKANKIKPKGASRDLKGMSGSGLWVPDGKDGVILAGILKGAKKDAGDPNIVFTPIWTIARRLAGLFPEKG